MNLKYCLGITAALFVAFPAAASTLNVALNADIRSTEPGFNRDDNTDGVVLNIIEGLVGYKEDGTVAPLLAEKVDVSDDLTSYTFHLRKGVKFHNGNDLTSDQVLWSWNYYMNPQRDWRCLTAFDGRDSLKVESVTAPDAHTVVMKLDRPSSMFLDALSRTDCGATGIIDPASVKSDGSWDKPVGTGPFQFSEWKRGEYVRLNKFADYKSPTGDKVDGYVGLKTPLVDEVKLIVVPDASSVKTGLLSGAIHASQIMDTDVAELAAHPELAVHYGAAASKNALIMQTNDPLLSNKKLRQAIAMALDPEQLVAGASNGLGKPNNSAIFPTSPYYSATQAKTYEYSPEKAQALLKEAGYKGETITLIANKRVHVPSYPAALIAQQMLQAVGINVKLEIMEWPAQLDRYRSGNFQMMSTTYSAQLDPALSYQQFEGPKDKQSQKVWDNPAAYDLIQKAMTIANKDERQKLFDQLHEMQLDDTPLYIMYSGVEPYAYSKRLSDLHYWQGKPLLWQAEIVK